MRGAVLVCVAIAGCSEAPASEVHADASTTRDAPVAETLAVESVSPAKGVVTGGTLLTIRGRGFTTATHVRIGTIDCTHVSMTSARELTCMTGSSDFVEGAMDVAITDGAQHASLSGAYTYECPWTTTTGRRSCGAVPPPLAEQQLPSVWITQFQTDHGFTVSPAGSANLEDTTDFVLGTQAAWFETDGHGSARTLQRQSTTPMSFVGQDLKLWIKVDDTTHLTTLDVYLGDATLANAFRFRLRSTQGQQWMTSGDWVAFAIPWTPSNYAVIGSPDRAAISTIAIRAADDNTGVPVRIHVNGLATVDEPASRFPSGVVSFTFDDGFATMVSAGAPALTAHSFRATAYVIVDMIGKANYTTLADLHTLADAGWDISAHAFTDAHHAAHYPTLTNAVVEDDMVDARAWLIANHFGGYNHCAYPSGEFKGAAGTDVLGLAGRYFTSCRTIYQRQQETYPPSDPRKLRVLYVTYDMPLATVQRAIDEAKTGRQWTILVFHQLVSGTPAVSTEWRASDFATVVDYVATSGVPVLPVSAVVQP